MALPSYENTKEHFLEHKSIISSFCAEDYREILSSGAIYTAMINHSKKRRTTEVS